MIIRGHRILAVGLAVSLMSLSLSPFCLTASAEGEKKSSTAKLSRAEIMVKRIGKGVNVDVFQLEGGSPIKVLYDPSQYDAVKAAGFQSVRFFIDATGLVSTGVVNLSSWVAKVPTTRFRSAIALRWWRPATNLR